MIKPLWQMRRIFPDQYPGLLQHLEKLPPHMDLIGELPPDDHRYLCVVGSRTHSSYGKEVCKDIISGLAGYPIVIVSGLAIGIDSLAHEAALEAGLKTVAFPGSGLNEDVLYPSSRHDLAQRIVAAGGALVSPFKPDQEADQWTFPVRNELMAGMSQAVLVIEAREDSGTMITADAAGELNRDTYAVPGSIFSDLSGGPHRLIREGAITVTCAEDVLEALGFEVPKLDKIPGDKNRREAARKRWLANPTLSEHERRIIKYIGNPRIPDDLLRKTRLQVSELNAAIVELELRGLVGEQDGYIVWKSSR